MPNSAGVACEIVGWNRILKEINHEIVDRDSSPEIGELIQIRDHRVGWGEQFLRVQCGTGRWFAIPVPRDVRTAQEANAWTYGIDPDDFLPEVRT